MSVDGKISNDPPASNLTGLVMAGVQGGVNVSVPGTLFQPIDADLMAIAALSTQTYGRSLLTLASATALAGEVDPFFLTPAEGNAAYQPLDSDLTAIAALTTASYGRSLLTVASAPALATSLGVIPDAIINYAADGGGAVNNVTPFTTAGAAGKMTFIPVPSAHYEFTTTLNGYDIGGAWLPDPAMTWAALTDSGQFNMYRGRRTSATNGANIWRLSDRVFVGEAASCYAGDVGGTDGGNSWTKNQTDLPWYLPLNAAVLWTSGGNSNSPTVNNSPYGFVAALKTSNVGQGGIAFGAAVVADQASANAWGFIAEMQREAGTSSVYAMEIDMKNKGANATITPNAQVVGTYGLWVVGGGDNSFGGSSVNPSTAAFVVLKNSNTWNSGLVFMKDSLTAGEAVALSSEGVGGAHVLRWYNASGNIVFNILSAANDTVGWNMNRINGTLQIAVGGTQAFAFSSASAPANGLTFSSAATTVAPSIAATGSDTNINLALTPKGTGNVTTAGGLLSSSGTGGVGYSTGAGGAVTQLTSRTTGVTLNKASGDITMFSAAGSATAATFTVTNSAVAATDTISLSQKSGTNLYNFIVSAVAAGSFNITFYTTGGTSTDAPVVHFNVIKGVNA